MKNGYKIAHFLKNTKSKPVFPQQILGAVRFCHHYVSPIADKASMEASTKSTNDTERRPQKARTAQRRPQNTRKDTKGRAAVMRGYVTAALPC